MWKSWDHFFSYSFPIPATPHPFGLCFFFHKVRWWVHHLALAKPGCWNNKPSNGKCFLRQWFISWSHGWAVAPHQVSFDPGSFSWIMSLWVMPISQQRGKNQGKTTVWLLNFLLQNNTYYFLHILLAKESHTEKSNVNGVKIMILLKDRLNREKQHIFWQ